MNFRYTPLPSRDVTVTVDGATPTRAASAPAGSAGPPSNSSSVRARVRSASAAATRRCLSRGGSIPRAGS